MAQRRSRWAERGWDNYKDVQPAGDAPVANGAAPSPAKATIPVRVYGSHEGEEEAQA